MKKLLGILIATIFLSSNAFALSNAYKKEIYEGCVIDSKAHLGIKRAKQYCLCTINMLSNRYSDSQFDQILSKSDAEALNAMRFAADHCNKHEKAF